jgi:hypothetical protein
MDYTLRFDSQHRVLLVTLGKVVTRVSALAAYIAVERFLAANGPCAEIADLSAVEKAEIPGSFVWSLARRPRAIFSGKPLILVAPKPVVYGLSRMFQIARDEEAGGYQVVHTFEEAIALLALETPDFRAVEEFAGAT